MRDWGNQEQPERPSFENPTAMMNTTGTFDAAGKVLSSTATMDDFTTGETITVWEALTLVSGDEAKLEMFAPGPDGKELRMMEIVYTRRK